MTCMSNSLNDLELEILDVLRMDPETAWLLAGMVVSEDGSSPSETKVRRALAGLAERGLVRAKGGRGPDSGGEFVKTTWWVLTAEGRALAESGPSAGL